MDGGKNIACLTTIVRAVAYTTLAERKVIGFIQGRIGPNRVGFRGVLQPIADALKLLTKEWILPTEASPLLFRLAPVLALAPSLAAWAVVPFAPGWVLADVNAGVLYLLAMTSLGVYGVLIAGWASTLCMPFLGPCALVLKSLPMKLPWPSL